MYCPDELMKINRFRLVAIPRNCEYMQRFGKSLAPSSSYTGDDFVPLAQNKIDSLADAEAYDRMMQKEEDSKSDGNS